MLACFHVLCMPQSHVFLTTIKKEQCHPIHTFPVLFKFVLFAPAVESCFILSAVTVTGEQLPLCTVCPLHFLFHLTHIIINYLPVYPSWGCHQYLLFCSLHLMSIMLSPFQILISPCQFKMFVLDFALFFRNLLLLLCAPRSYFQGQCKMDIWLKD